MRQSELKNPVFVLAIFALMVFQAGCTKERRENSITGGSTGPIGATNLASLQNDIFNPGCAISGCHDNSANPAAALNLSSIDKSHAYLVNRASVQVPSRKLVTPNDPSKSYLIDKLLGTQSVVGGSGVRMPQYAAALSQENMDRIIDWINEGAPRN